MKKHRIRSVKSIDENPRPHILLEIAKDRWLGVEPHTITHDGIHRLLRKEKKDQCFYICFAERAFHIGIIRNWSEAGYVC